MDWTRSRKSDYLQTAVQEPWGATVPTSTGYQNVTVAFDTRAAPFVSLKV